MGTKCVGRSSLPPLPPETPSNKVCEKKGIERRISRSYPLSARLSMSNVHTLTSQYRAWLKMALHKSVQQTAKHG